MFPATPRPPCPVPVPVPIISVPVEGEVDGVLFVRVSVVRVYDPERVDIVPAATKLPPR